MSVELWGTAGSPYLAQPERLLGYLLFIVYGLLFAFTVYYYRLDFRRLTRRQWLITAALAVAALIFSRLLSLPLALEDQLAPLSSAQNPRELIAPFSAVPLLLAAILLNPAAAVLIGFVSGLGRALWETHQITDPFHFALAALLTITLLRQNYLGRLYNLLRRPIVAGPLSLLFTLPLVGLAAFAYAEAGASNLEAFDLAVSTTGARILPLLVEGLLAGLIISLVLIGLPQLQKQRRLIPSPQNKSLNRRLFLNFLLFATSLTLILILVGFNLSVQVSTQLVVDQMAHDARSVSASIPDFRAHRQNLLTQYSHDAGLLNDSQPVLRQLFRTGSFYRRILLVDATQEIVDYYPADDPENNAAPTLTDLERVSVAGTLQNSAPFISPAQITDVDNNYMLSFIVPVFDSSDRPVAALIGRVPDFSLAEMIIGLQGTVGEGQGFLVDERNQIIAHPNTQNLLTSWNPIDTEQRPINTGEEFEGAAYEGRAGGTNARELVYYQTGPNHPWTVVVTVPYEVVLRLALRISTQLTIVLMVAMLLFGTYLLYLGRSITQPITQLAQVSQSIAGGSLNTPIEAQGDDEIGRLGQAFEQMQIALKQRLDELSLLLSVSQEVSSSIDINQGMPAILQGTLRGTGASGVRVVVLNPSGRQPLTFGEGPAAKGMGRYDRQVMNLLRQHEELQLTTSRQVQGMLEPDGSRQPAIRAMIALPLATRNRFQGIFWLGYRRPHEFDQSELNLLRTLAGQASVLVENARLYATSEGGRRRLAAVLASTTDAVIVTDQTERILLLNPAMERFFNLRASDAMGRPIADVIESERLVEALTSSAERTRDLEIPTDDGRMLHASASTIMSNDGQAMGRVAVLHDITSWKELDEMKSEFVATVSHDLRSPLTFMRGYATMLPMIAALDDKQQEYVDKILTGIEQMSGLVNNLLDLSRLEAGVDLVVTRFQVRELMASVLDEHIQPAKEVGINLIMDAPRNLPTVTGDISLIRQAITNYVSNTFKYAPDSGEVRMSAALQNGEVIISVADNGPGIPQEAQMRLFEKFYRVKDRGTVKVKGSGLGLALVKSIAERHGGRAWCESEIGRGSTFYLSLPANGGG